MSVYEPDGPQVDPGLFELGVPVLACATASAHGPQPRRNGRSDRPTRVRGTAITLESDGGHLLQDFPAEDTVWMSHGDAVTEVPRVPRHSRTDAIPVASMEDLSAASSPPSSTRR